MYMKIIASLVTSVMLFSACSGDNSVDLKEGKWSVTTTTVMEGMPFQMPPITVTECLTKDDYMPKQQSQDDPNKCKILNHKIQNSTVSWDMQCPHSHTFMTITYKYDTFSGEMKMQTDEEGGSVKMNATMQGKYIGSCK